jgi:hypothetical protein
MCLLGDLLRRAGAACSSLLFGMFREIQNDGAFAQTMVKQERRPAGRLSSDMH